MQVLRPTSATVPNITQPQANRLNEVGANILCLDVPQGSSFGIDYLTFTIGPKFQGVKMIPPGCHFIHASMTDSIRNGFFFWFEQGDVLVRTFNDRLGCMVPLADNDEIERYILGVRRHDFDAGMGPYPLQTLTKWNRLTSHVSKSVVERLTSVNASRIPPSHASADQKMGDDERKAAEEYDRLRELANSCRSYYTKIPSIKSFYKSLSPIEISRLNMDRTPVLQHVLNKLDNNILELLGELQYAFVEFFIGQSVDGLEQWKQLVHLVCSCESALEGSLSGFYVEFLKILMYQLNEMPKDFFSDELTHDNFFNQSLPNFFEIVRESDVTPEVTHLVGKIKELLKTRFGKVFEDDEAVEEDVPVVSVPAGYFEMMEQDQNATIVDDDDDVMIVD